MIEVKNLSKFYGERAAIRQLNFKIEKGDVVGLLGPNGAGKSTTMKILTGFMAPSEGEAWICGYDVFENPIEVKKRIGYLPELPPVYPDMRVEDYLKYVANLKQVSSHLVNQQVEDSLQKTQLTSVRQRLIRNLSKGFKQRVGIAQALVSNPEVLVLDEPTVGLDPKQVAEVRELINALKGQHTIILSTHILSEVQATCNKVIIIHQGQIVAQENIDQISSLNQGIMTLSVKVKQSTNLVDQFKKIKGVNSVEAISAVHFKVSYRGNENIADLVAQVILSQNAGIIEISPDRESLENVFLKLTYGQSHQEPV